MKPKSTLRHFLLLPAALVSLLLAGHSNAAITAHTGTTSNNNSNTWADPLRWDNGVPTGIIDVLINANQIAYAGQDNDATVTVDAYTGSLTLGSGSSLKVIRGAFPNALGTTTIFLNSDSNLSFRGIGTQTVGNTIQLTGNDALISTGESTATAGVVTFAGGITGNHDLLIGGNNNSRGRFTTSNSFASLTTLGDRGFGDENWILEANATGSLGLGDVTINDTDSLIINAANAMFDGAALYLNGTRANKTGVNKVNMNADDTIAALFIDGVQQAAGDYTSSNTTWITGSGTLTVVPEPRAALLGGLGLLALLRRRR